MKFSKKLISTLFIAQNILTPIAFAEKATTAATVQKNFDHLAKSEQTYLELWLNVRDQFSAQDQTLIDAWVLLKNNSQSKNKEIRTTAVKSTDGDKGLRAYIETSAGSNSYDILFNKNDDIKINKTAMEDLDTGNVDQLIRNLARGNFNKEVLLSQTLQELEPETLAQLSPEQRAIYMIHQRKLLELSRQVLAKKKKAASVNSKLYFLLFNSEAFAATGGKCFNSLGYITTLDASGNCPEAVVSNTQYSNISCSSGQLCNPSYYGLNRTQSGQGICLTSADLAAGKSCSDLSPLKTQEDVRSLMSSMMKGGGARPEKPPEGGGAPPQGGKNPVSEFIEQALKSCEESNLQSSATCKELMSRKTLMNGFMVQAKGGQGGRQGPGSGDRGSEPRRQQSSTNDRDTSNLSSSSSSDKSDCGFFCSAGRWLTSTAGVMSMLTVATGVGVYFWTKNKYKKSSTTASTTTTDTTVTTTGTYSTYGLPTAPTAADYTGVAQ